MIRAAIIRGRRGFYWGLRCRGYWRRGHRLASIRWFGCGRLRRFRAIAVPVAIAARTDRIAQIQKRPERLADMRLQPPFQAQAHRLQARALQLLVMEHRNAWANPVRALNKARDRILVPPDASVVGQFDRGIRRRRQLVGPRGNHGPQGFRGGRAQGFAIRTSRARVGNKAEALETAHIVALHHHLTFCRNLRHQIIIEVQALHQHAGASVNKPLGQRLVQGVRQPVFNLSGARLPMGSVGKPVRPVRHKSPGADIGNTRRQRIDIAFGDIEPVHMATHPVLRQLALMIEQMLIEGA